MKFNYRINKWSGDIYISKLLCKLERSVILKILQRERQGEVSCAATVNRTGLFHTALMFWTIVLTDMVLIIESKII